VIIRANSVGAMGAIAPQSKILIVGMAPPWIFAFTLHVSTCLDHIILKLNKTATTGVIFSSEFTRNWLASGRPLAPLGVYSASQTLDLRGGSLQRGKEKEEWRRKYGKRKGVRDKEEERGKEGNGPGKWRGKSKGRDGNGKGVEEKGGNGREGGTEEGKLRPDSSF